MQALIFRCLILWGKGDFEIVRCTSNAIELVPLDRLQPSCTRPGSIANQFTNLKIFLFNISSAKTLKFIFRQFHFTYYLSDNCLDFLIVGILLIEKRPLVAPQWTVNSPRRYVLKNRFFIEFGLKNDSIQNSIQNKIQNIHSKKYSFNRVQNIR